MRTTSLLLGALVLLPLAAQGQDASPETTPRSATVRPADVVAETLVARLSERGATRLDDATAEASMELRKKEGYF